MKPQFVLVLLLCIAGAVGRSVVADVPDGTAANKPSDDTIREFHNAVAAGDRRLAEKMLGSYPDMVSAPRPDEDAAKRIEPVFTAIDHAQAPMLEMLLKHGASYVRGASGQTPLDRATIFGTVDVVKVLLDAGANVDGLDDPANVKDLDVPSHCTPLRDAVSCGHMEIARLLVQRGAHVDLHSAAGLGWTDWVSKQIAQHPELTDFSDDWRYTPLCYAVAGGCAGTADVLLQHGADVTHTYDDGGTLLHLATVNGDHALISVLLSNGVSINAKNKAGETALDFAIKYRQLDAAELLKEHAGKRGSQLP
jgi:ankyrin repeat protein